MRMIAVKLVKSFGVAGERESACEPKFINCLTFIKFEKIVRCFKVAFFVSKCLFNE